MDSRRLLLTAFPMSVLCLFAADRFATYLLGIYPSAPALWYVWLELRSLFWPLSQQLDVVAGQSIALQVCLLGLAALLVLAAAFNRKRVAIAFLVNHATLIVAAASVVLAANPRVAGFGFVDAEIDFGLASLPLSQLTIAVLAMGAATCAYCHYLFLAESRKGWTTVSSRIMELQRDL